MVITVDFDRRFGVGLVKPTRLESAHDGGDPGAVNPVQIGADGGHRTDDHYRDEKGYQAIFDGGDTRLVPNETEGMFDRGIVTTIFGRANA